MIAYASCRDRMSSRTFNIEKFQPYIEGVPFTVIAEHYSLLRLNSIKNPSGKLARWAIRLRQHTFNLIHRKGIHNVVPDALSRIPNQAVEECNFHTPITGRIAVVDSDRIDPWYDNLRQKIRDSPENFPQWKVENDFVYKFIPNQLLLKVNVPEWKILVPNPQREEIIDNCYTPRTSGHFEDAF